MKLHSIIIYENNQKNRERGGVSHRGGFFTTLGAVSSCGERERVQNQLYI